MVVIRLLDLNFDYQVRERQLQISTKFKFLCFFFNAISPSKHRSSLLAQIRYFPPLKNQVLQVFFRRRDRLSEWVSEWESERVRERERENKNMGKPSPHLFLFLVRVERNEPDWLRHFILKRHAKNLFLDLDSNNWNLFWINQISCWIFNFFYFVQNPTQLLFYQSTTL